MIVYSHLATIRLMTQSMCKIACSEPTCSKPTCSIFQLPHWAGLHVQLYRVLSSWLHSIWLYGYSVSMNFNTVLLLLYLLVIRGVPSLIIAQAQVLAPLHSQPVDGYRKGGATPIISHTNKHLPRQIREKDLVFTDSKCNGHVPCHLP